MKTNKLKFYVIVFLLLAYKSNATHMAGGVITYVNKGNYKYDVYVELYRDCRGVPIGAPAVQVLDNKTKATITSFTPSEIKVKDITNTCTKASAKCNPPNTWGTGRGFEMHTYFATIDLSNSYKNGICEVLIITNQCCRNGAITTGASGSLFYVWSMVNICVGNSSSEIYSKEGLSLACNRPAYLSFKATDSKEKDSLVYELTDPMSGLSSKISYSGGFSATNPVSVYYPKGYNKSLGPNPYSNPPIGLFFNRNSGDMVFTPVDCSEVTIFAVRIYEYRKDSTSGKYILAGYTTRENFVEINSASENNTPIVVAPENIIIKDNEKTCFNISTYDSPYITSTGKKNNNDTTTLIMLPFVTKNSKDATFTINYSKAKLKQATVCWEPHKMESNTPYIMTFKTTDNNCDYYGFAYKSINIYVQNTKKIAWVSGTTFYDINKNCKQDSNETYIPNQLISVKNKSLNYKIESDSSGNFNSFVFSGIDTFKIQNNNGAFVCSKTLKIDSTKTYNFDLGINSRMTIKGTLYIDSKKNCKLDSTEKHLKNQMVYTVPGNYITSTDTLGNYVLSVPAGNYEVKFKPKSSNFFVGCSPEITINSYIDTMFLNQNIAIIDSASFLDYSANIVCSGIFKRNDKNEIAVIVRNKGGIKKDGVVTLKFNKKLKFVSATSYSNKTDSTIKWSFSKVGADTDQIFYIVLNTDTTTCKLNDTMNVSAWIDSTINSNDYKIADNYDFHKLKIANNINSTEKQELLSNGYNWRENNKLRYYIGFRNTSKTSVKNIDIVDTLNFPIAGSSFQMLGASHTYEYSIINNVLFVTFPNINLPDSGADKIKSYGYFEFSVNIDPKLNSETKFYNRAQIYYDTVVPVNTNKIYNTYTSYIKTGNTNSNEYCVSDSFKLSFTSKFKFNKGNKFKLLIMKRDWTYGDNIYVIDSINSTSPNGKFASVLPSNIESRNYYIAKVISTDPYSKELSDGISNTFYFVSNADKPIITLNDTLICSNDSIKFNLQSNFDSIKIFDRNQLLAKINNSSNFKLKIAPGKHYITAVPISKLSCALVSDTLIFKNDTIPNIDIKCTSHTNNYGCLGDTITLKASNCYSYNFYEKYKGFLEENKTGIYSKVFDYGLSEIRAIGSSKYGCIDTSSWITMDIFDEIPPTITFSDADNIICSYQSLTVTPKGSFVSYQLYKNNVKWLNTFTSSISVSGIKDNDSIKVQGTSTYGCKKFSKNYGFKVVQPPKILMTCTDSDTTLCDGVNSNTAVFNFSGVNVTKIYKNGNFNRSVTNNTVSIYSIEDADVFYGEGADSYGCKNYSNSIEMRVIKPNATLTINKNGIVCDNDSVYFEFKGGVAYDIVKNSNIWKTLTSQKYSIQSMAQNDTVFIKSTDKYGCKAQSVKYIFNILKSPEVKITNKDADNTHCSGEEVIIDLTGVAKYDIYKNNSIWKSNVGSEIKFTDVIDKDEIYAKGKAANGCSDTSNKIKFNVYPIPSKPLINRIGNDLYSNYTKGNQWFDQSSKINGATNQKYTPVKFDNYFVQHTSDFGCLSPLSDKYSFTTGIKSINEIGIKIYPNPSKGKINIETQNASDYSLKLFDIMGKLVESTNFVGKNFEWNLNLIKGIYLLRISNEKGEISSQLIEFL